MAKKPSSFLEKIGTGIGVGIMAGVAGTAAITLSQMIEMKINNRKPGEGPIKAVERTLDIHPNAGTRAQFGNRVHWIYGTSWGIVRGLLGITGMGRVLATTVHYVAITGVGMAIAPLEDVEPVMKWDKKTVAIDLFHHAVYAVAAGLVFDAIRKR